MADNASDDDVAVNAAGRAHSPVDAVPRELSEAMAAALTAPERDSLWDRAEEIVQSLQRPDELSALYIRTVERGESGELVERLGVRAVRFHDEWIQDPKAIIRILNRVVDKVPAAAWAFDRLSLTYTNLAQWKDLLGLYDRVLAITAEPERRRELLHEAARVARDFSDDAERAAKYMRDQLELDPSGGQVATSLERLLLDGGQHREVISLWSERIATLPATEALVLRARIASRYLDPLDDAESAFEQIETALNAGGGSEFYDLAERIGVRPTASRAIRRQSLELLRKRYLRAENTADLERILTELLSCSDDPDLARVHRELAELLGKTNREADSIRHWAAVVALDPEAADARKELRGLAERHDAHVQYADALVAAAERTPGGEARANLFVEAARVRIHALADVSGGSEMYLRALNGSSVPQAIALRIARTLATQLDPIEDGRDRLDVLERLASLASDKSEVRETLGEAARQAEKLGDVDRAVASWQKRLEIHRSDAEALQALIDLLDRAERWPLLIATLEHRIEVRVEISKRATSKRATRKRTANGPNDPRLRDDLIRMARIFEVQLNDLESASRTWTQVEAWFGPDGESETALATLARALGRFDDLADRLGRAAERALDSTRRAQLLSDKADVYRDALNLPERAAEFYGAALSADVRCASARASLIGLLDAQKCSPQAVKSLNEAFAMTGDGAATLGILEHRLRASMTPEERSSILLESAAISEAMQRDDMATLDLVGRAFAEVPEDPQVEAEMLRWTAATGAWTLAVEAYRAAIAASTERPARVIHLTPRMAAVLETGTRDLPAALQTYQRALRAQPNDVEIATSVIRVAVRLQQWTDAVGAVVESTRNQSQVAIGVVEAFENFIEQASAWDSALLAMEAVIASDKELSAAASANLETQLARWQRDRCKDLRSAEASLLRAVSHRPDDAALLRALAAIQRTTPSPSLVRTLIQLADLSSDDLETLYEAAVVAVDTAPADGGTGDIVSRYLDRAIESWRSQPGTDAPTGLSWALEQLVQILSNRADYEACATLLLAAAQLPFPPPISRELRRRGAAIVADSLRNDAWATELYRGLRDEDPRDAEVTKRLAALYQSANRLDDLLSLYQRALKLADSLERRIETRLDLARCQSLRGETEASIAALRTNLEEHPGHSPSVAELTHLLEESGQFSDLVEMLVAQAKALDVRGEHAGGAKLWGIAAVAFEERLHDLERSRECHENVVSHAVAPASFEALARIHHARNEHALEAQWLESLLLLAETGARSPLAIRLARANAAAGNRARSIELFTEVLQTNPAHAEARELLAGLYRSAEQWTALVETLVGGCDYVRDDTARANLLRESAEIYVNKLGLAASAIPLLERASAIRPTDVSLRVALAEAMRMSVRLDDAKRILDTLLQDYGRRRPPERAVVHWQLAQVARARTDTQEALSQLELAASIDLNHIGVLRMWGDVARDSGQLDRSERAFRTLLLIVGRYDADRDDGTQESSVGPAEISYELYRIADRQEQSRRARELLESAFELASKSFSESRRLERAFRKSGAKDLLARALKSRLARTTVSKDGLAVLDELQALGPASNDEALQWRLSALRFDPRSESLHERAIALATELNRLADYANGLEALADAARDGSDHELACELLLRLGDFLERQLHQTERAASIYLAAEALGAQSLRACLALDRVYAAQGNTAAQARILGQIAKAPPGELEPARRTDALIRLSEIQLNAMETRAVAVDTLLSALDEGAEAARAVVVLARAAELMPTDARVVTAYEKIARALRQDAALLDALHRRMPFPDATIDLAQEGAELAARLESTEKERVFCLRAIALATQSDDSTNDALWAYVSLSERARSVDDRDGARHWLVEAAGVKLSGRDVTAKTLDIAGRAARDSLDLSLSAELYERLRQRDPTSRVIWEPLLQVYRKLGDERRLEETIKVVADSVFDSDARNLLRLESAKGLVDKPDRWDEAISTLRYVLADDSANIEAGSLLREIFRRANRNDELLALLKQQLTTARERRDAAEVATLTLELGPKLAESDRLAALDMYERSAIVVPQHRGVLEALHSLYSAEDSAEKRGDILEKLLALESGERAAEMASQLADLRDDDEDFEAVARALERGLTAQPDSRKLRDRLLQLYPKLHNYARLAELIEQDASSQPDGELAATLFHQAGVIRRDQVRDFAQAAKAFRNARERAPDQSAILIDLVACLRETGDLAAAVEEISTAMARATDDISIRAELLRRRAEIHGVMGNDLLEVSDLEEGFKLAPEACKDALADALERRCRAAAKNGDRVAMSAATVRLAEVFELTDRVDRACELLTAWLKHSPKDANSWRLLAAMNTRAQRWDAAIDALERLVANEEGKARVEAVLKLCEACEHAERPLDARDSLENVLRAMPKEEAVRQKLKTVYEQSGAHLELAELATEEATHARDEAERFKQLVRAGELWLRSVGEPTKALEVLSDAQRLRPGDLEATGLMADALLELGRSTEATAILKQVVESNRTRRARELGALQYRLGRIALTAGDRAGALTWLASAIENDMQSGPIASDLAELALEMDDHELALKALRAIALMKNPSPMTRAMAFHRQGIVALRQGDKKKAVFYAKKALGEDPTSAETIRFLKELGSS